MTDIDWQQPDWQLPDDLASLVPKGTVVAEVSFELATDGIPAVIAPYVFAIHSPSVEAHRTRHQLDVQILNLGKVANLAKVTWRYGGNRIRFACVLRRDIPIGPDGPVLFSQHHYSPGRRIGSRGRRSRGTVYTLNIMPVYAPGRT